MDVIDLIDVFFPKIDFILPPFQRQQKEENS
jgi:hypothetical protein